MMEEASSEELQREDISSLSQNSIKILKAVLNGRRKREEIGKETGITGRELEKELKTLEERKFIVQRGEENPSYLPTKKARKMFLGRSWVHLVLYSGLVATFFTGLIELSRFVSLFAPLKFRGRPSDFWLLFYSKASWWDGLLTVLMFLLSLGFAYLIMERKEKERMLVGS